MNQDSLTSGITAFLNQEAPPIGGTDQPVGDPNRPVIHSRGPEQPIEGVPSWRMGEPSLITSETATPTQ
jgi:hypothetical protein